MFTFARPLYDGATADLNGGIFLLWDRGPGTPSLQDALLANIIRQRLEGLPSYGVFDSLRFRLDGETVILTGFAANRDLASDALQAVSDLPVVEKVINLVELLPDSLEDDMIRAEAYARLYADPVLSSYRSIAGPVDSIALARGAQPRSGFGFHGIRIIVKHGKLALLGQVASHADAERACRLARTIHGIVGVECELTVTGNWN